MQRYRSKFYKALIERNLILPETVIFDQKVNNMYTARQIADYFLSISNPEVGDDISNLKLQKLLYYAQGVHLAAYGTPLFEDEIAAWNYGPVVESVYDDFKVFGSAAILTASGIQKESLPDVVKDFLHNVYFYYGQFLAWKLSLMSHEETPWKTTRRMHKIPKEIMREYFETQPYISDITNPTLEQRLRNAAALLLADYEQDKELTVFSVLDGDDFYEED